MNNIFKSFIPKRISNKTVIRFYDLFRKLSGVSDRVIATHKEANRAVLSDAQISPLKEEPGYIENQREWKEVLIGKGKNPTMQKSGCGVFAVYNALLALGEDVGKETLPELIAAFEKQGVVLSGRWGVSPRAIYRYFQNNGFDTAMTMSRDAEVINRIGKDYTVNIVTVYNNKEDIMQFVHTVCVTKNERGEYFAHNAYYRKGNTYIAMPLGEKGFTGLQETIEHLAKNPQAICVIGINKRSIL